MSSKEPILRRQPQQQRSQERVEQILKAAAEVFWEMGYDAATTHAIAIRAQTAVGSLYRFFPNKLAIFHALEKQHRQRVEAINARLLTPDFMQQPLVVVIQQFVEIFAQYFEDPAPRVVYTQYFLAPDMFVYFDDSFTYGLIRRFADLMRLRNANLSVEKSELIAEVCIQSYNALLLVALRSGASHRTQLYLEIQDLLINYLQPHVGDHLASSVDAVNQQIAAMTQQYGLNPRQKSALTYLLKHNRLTIQTFEALCPQPSRRTLQRDLKQLVDKGLLQSEGDTNQLVYRVASNK